MPATPATRVAWLKLLFSTEPADRPRAESGVRDLYAASGFPPPRYFLWFDSPFDAAWAVAMLDAKHDDTWGRIIGEATRSPTQRQKMESVQADICRRLAEADWPGACASIGLPFNCLSPDRPRQFFELRLTLYPSVAALWKAGAFTADGDDLYRAELYFLGIPSGVLGNQEIARPVGLKINSSLRTLYPYSVIAADQAQCHTPPPLLAALWEIACACGPWWTFEHAAILTDRPAEIHVNDRFLLHCGDGPAVVYRDAATAWAWDGHVSTEEWIMHPERIPPGVLRNLDTAFRRHAEQRMSSKPAPKSARAQGNFLSRYLAGDCQQVWADLVALGPDVRKPRYKSEALEVARETMRRVEANVRTVVARLLMLNYRFKTKGMWLDESAARSESILGLPGAADSPYAERLRESTKRQREQRRLTDYEIRAHIPPGPDAAQHLKELDKQAGTVPLSLWAFYEIVGEVDLIGHHDQISPEADPLVVFPLEAMLQSCGDEITEEGRIPIAPDHYHKANISGGAPYEIALPDPRADAELLNEPHNLLFVDYLRLVFRHGGFPGYAGMDRDVPKEIAILAQDLQPF
jgi:hypothetical protein